MKKFIGIELLSLLTILIFASILIGSHLFQAQMAAQGKPSKTQCNYNGICEKGECSGCLDCEQIPSPPLQLDHYGLQIVTGSEVDDAKVYCLNWINGSYTKSWNSSVHEGFTHATSIGDVDNDDKKEIITVVNAKRKGKVPAYQKIFVYEDGSTGSPNYTSQNLGPSVNGIRDAIIADADNDGQNELVLAEEYHIEIYKWNGSGFSLLWNSPEYDYFIWSVDVGDADNDGGNEVVISMFGMGSAIVYEYLGNNTWGNPIATQSIGYCNIDCAKVRDADNDGLNEIVGGGTSNKMNVWEYVSDSYVLSFLSDDLGGFTQGVDAGDVDGDGKNEVIAGTSGNIDKIYIFRYNQITATYEIVDSISCSGGVSMLSTGDLDNDAKDEIAAYVSGIAIYKSFNGHLESIYNFPCGGYLEIK